MKYEILLRMASLLALLTLLGAGPGARLPREWDLAGRVALAPAFGLAIGAVGLTTANFFVALGGALWWGLLPLAAISCAVAARGARRPRRAELVPLAALAVAGALVIALASYPLGMRHSFGPTGYGIFDGPGYAWHIEGYQRETNAEPLGLSPTDPADPRWDGTAWSEHWDIGERFGWAYRWQHTGSDTVLAAVSAATGWPPWTLISPFMAVLLAIGAAGTFALTRVVAPRSLLLAAWAALLYGGPLLFGVHVDGSQGLLAGLALLPAILALGLQSLGAPSWRRTVLLGVLLAGLQTIYAELVPLLAASGALALLGLAVVRRRRLSWAGLRVATAHVAAVVALCALLSPRAAVWTVDYLANQLSGTALLQMLIHYDMSARLLPGWLLQTRDFYSFALAAPQAAGLTLWSTLVPALAALLIAYGLWHRRAAVPLLALLGGAALQSLAASRQLDCSYCVQRTLLTLAPVLPVLLAAGAAAAWAGGKVPRAAASALVAIVTIGAARTMADAETRAVDAAYLPSPALASIAEDVRRLKGAGPIALEGFDATPLWSWADLPVTYGALRHDSDRRLSLPATYNDRGGLSYLGTRPRGHPAFTPDYEWVLQRFGRLDSGREVVARRGPYAIERRTDPFDALVVRGVAVDPPTDDPVGVAWLQAPGSYGGLSQGPLTVWVSARSTRRAWLSLRLVAAPETRLAGRRISQRHDAEGRLVACLPVAGSADLREVTATVSPPPGSLLPAANRWGNPPLASKGVELQALRVSAADCSRSPSAAFS